MVAKEAFFIEAIKIQNRQINREMPIMVPVIIEHGCRGTCNAISIFKLEITQ